MKQGSTVVRPPRSQQFYIAPEFRGAEGDLMKWRSITLYSKHHESILFRKSPIHFGEIENNENYRVSENFGIVIDSRSIEETIFHATTRFFERSTTRATYTSKRVIVGNMVRADRDNQEFNEIINLFS